MTANETSLTTERLLLREAREEDAEDMHRLNSDPRVMKYTYETPSESVEKMREAIRNYPDYSKHGFGRWSTFLDGIFVVLRHS